MLMSSFIEVGSHFWKWHTLNHKFGPKLILIVFNIDVCWQL